MHRATRWIFLALAVALLGAIIYHPVRHFDFINLDDPHFVKGNPQLAHGLTWQSLSWAFHANLDYHSERAEYWAPLTLLTRILDAQFYGPDAAGAFHVTSALFHLGNTLLFAIACWALTRHWGRSAVVALLFLVHPQNIEAVCWLSARKDLVSATFLFLTLIAYAWYARLAFGRYALLLFTFAGGLMAKPMGVSIPFLLLVLDFWPLARWRTGPESWRENVRLGAEKLPLLILAGLASGLAVVSQQDWGALGDEPLPLAIRLGNAALSYFTYLRRLFWPSDLCFYYPHPTLLLPWLPAIAAAVFMSVATVTIWFFRRRLPWLFTGWLWFGLVLGPVIGLVQIGSQAMADRYAYPSMIGLFIALVWTVAERLPARLAAALGGVALIAFTAVSIPQVRTWRNSIAACQQALAVTSRNDTAHVNLGDALADQGDFVAARAQFRIAAEIAPNRWQIWNNLALMESRLGDDEAAARAYTEVLRCDENQKLPLLFFGRACSKKHERWATAAKVLEHLREIASDLPQPYFELGEVYAAQKRYPEARQAWQRYLELRPDDQALRARLEALPRE